MIGFLWRLAKTGAKVGIVCAAVKLTVDHDVWSTNTGKGADNYSKYRESILPGVKYYSSKLPSYVELRQNVVEKWNNVVKTVFNPLDFLRYRPSSSSTSGNQYISKADENRLSTQNSS